jgi:hypothetical protein
VRANGRLHVSAQWDVGDPEVDEFVDVNVASFAAWDLLVYLNRNPRLCDTMPSMAAVLGRPEHDLIPAIERLVDSGTLIEDDGRSPASMCYRLSDDPAVRDVITRFVGLAGKREHRLEFVRRVLAHIAAD